MTTPTNFIEAFKALLGSPKFTEFTNVLEKHIREVDGAIDEEIAEPVKVIKVEKHQQLAQLIYQELANSGLLKEIEPSDLGALLALSANEIDHTVVDDAYNILEVLDLKDKTTADLVQYMSQLLELHAKLKNEARAESAESDDIGVLLDVVGEVNLESGDILKTDPADIVATRGNIESVNSVRVGDKTITTVKINGRYIVVDNDIEDLFALIR